MNNAILRCEAPVEAPRSLSEALRIRGEDPEATVIAGGTDMMVMLEAGMVAPRRFLSLWGVPELRGIAADGARIGALATWTEVRRHPALPPALRECAATVGAIQIQNRGTVAGNIVNASPAGDSLPLWLALDAEFEVASRQGSRRIAAGDFWVAYRRVAMAPDELLVAIHLPKAHPGDRVAYRKVGTRMAQSISKVMLGGRLRVEEGVVTEARVAFGSVAPVPVRARAAEAALVGAKVSGGPGPGEARGGTVEAAAVEAAAIDKAVAALAADIKPIDDVRSTATYRAKVAGRILRGWLGAV